MTTSEQDAYFKCRDCDYRTANVNPAETHERRTGHDVWEIEKGSADDHE